MAMFLAKTALCALAVGLAVGSPAAGIELNRDSATLIDRINRGVNRQYAPLAPFDDPRDGVWDCENYAAEKMARLAAAGVPLSDLSLWWLRTSAGEAHAVLVVKTTRRGRTADLVLDNLSAWAVPRTALPYTEWAPLALDWRDASATGRRPR